MKTNLDIDINGYIVKASNGKTIGVCSNENKIYAKRLNKDISEILINFFIIYRR